MLEACYSLALPIKALLIARERGWLEGKGEKEEKSWKLLEFEIRGNQNCFEAKRREKDRAKNLGVGRRERGVQKRKGEEGSKLSVGNRREKCARSFIEFRKE